MRGSNNILPLLTIKLNNDTVNVTTNKRVGGKLYEGRKKINQFFI